MNIREEHMYHGAALNQIAEDRRFTAINAFRYNGKTSRSAFRINDDIGVYLKYASRPSKTFGEYKFTFTSANLRELKALERKCERIFVALICITDGHICALPYDELVEMIELRKESRGKRGSRCQIFATLPKKSNFQVYTSPFGRKGMALGKRKIPRNDFPRALFD